MESQKQSLPSTLQNLLPKVNVSKTERVLMLAAGGYLLYKMFSKKDSSTSKMALGSGMLLRGITGYCPAYHAMETLKDNKSTSSSSSSSNVNIRVTSEINKPIFQVYAFWRNLENLPKFMSHLASVEEIDNVISEWTAKGPMGVGQISWKAKIVKEEKGELLSWKSVEGSTIDNAGKVVFKPSENGTIIDVTISYRAPLGTVGESAAKLLNPYFESMVKEDIESLKEYLESGQQ